MNIVIVGAGIVGCAVAYELASRGAHVRVVDERGVGRGATRASAGMLAPYIEGHFEALRTLGARSLALYDEFVSRAAADAGAAVEYERSGSLHVAVDDSDQAVLAQTAADLRSAGIAHELLDPGETRALEPGVRPGICGSLHIPAHGYVAPAELTRALAGAAARRGAAFETVRATVVEPGPPPRVRTDTSSIAADAVIVAAGSWSGFLAAAHARDKRRPGTDASAAPDASSALATVRPIRGQLMRLRMPARPASRLVWGNDCYLVPWRDGTVLAGATVEDVGFDERATVAAVRRLLDASTALLPALGTAAFEEVRVGLRPLTPDELPVVGPSSTCPGLFYATGHYRNGVLLAPLTAMLIADLLIEGRENPELALVEPKRVGL